MTNTAPVFYDCEASCIGGLPIEIGWAFVDMLTGEIRSKNHVVKPPSHWIAHQPMAMLRCAGRRFEREKSHDADRLVRCFHGRRRFA